jgi:hypothetical protein
MIAFEWNDHSLTLLYRVNFIPVYNNLDIQKTKQYLLFPGNDNIIGRRNRLVL